MFIAKSRNFSFSIIVFSKYCLKLLIMASYAFCLSLIVTTLVNIYVIALTEKKEKQAKDK